MLIRKANVKDAEMIATYLFLAMTDIVYTFIGEEDPVKGMAFMAHFVRQENNQYSYQNCWVAEKNREVVAAINLYDGAALHELREPVIKYLNTVLNRDIIFEDETQAGEFYLDTIAVHPDRRSEGIGTSLLTFIIDEYVTRNNRTLGLLVDKDNPNAKRLYLKLGFSPVRTRTLFGKDVEHLQLRK